MFSFRPVQRDRCLRVQDLPAGLLREPRGHGDVHGLRGGHLRVERRVASVRLLRRGLLLPRRIQRLLNGATSSRLISVTFEHDLTHLTLVLYYCNNYYFVNSVRLVPIRPRASRRALSATTVNTAPPLRAQLVPAARPVCNKNHFMSSFVSFFLT